MTSNVPIPDLKSSIVKALLSEGHTAPEAKIIAETLMYAELRNNNQGIIKVVTGGLKKNPDATRIETVFDTPVSCQLSGGNIQGMVVVSSAVEVAMRKASQCGVAVVGASGYASATGAIGHWANKMATAGYVSIVMSQCSEMVAPHGSYEPIFGTNPMAFGIPSTTPPPLPAMHPLQPPLAAEANASGTTPAATEGPVSAPTSTSSSVSAEDGDGDGDGDDYPSTVVLDMATSAYAWYGLVTAAKAGEQVPGDVAYDGTGKPTTDPTAAMVGGALRSFDRSYKGSHLALMVELLAGALTGASMTDKAASKNWGTLVVCLHPGVLGDAEGFVRRAKEMGQRVRHAKPLPTDNTAASTPAGGTTLKLPGEHGEATTRRNLRNGYLSVPTSTYNALIQMGQGQSETELN